MKAFFVLVILLFIGARSEAQIFKKLGQKIKDEVNWRTERKADQKIDQGLDTLGTLPGKINNKKKATESNPQDTSKNKKKSSGNTKTTADANDMTDKIEHDLNYSISARKE